jgi:hypothetical protein
MHLATRSRHSICLGLSLELLELPALSSPPRLGLETSGLVPRETAQLYSTKLVQRTIESEPQPWEGSAAHSRRATIVPPSWSPAAYISPQPACPAAARTC